MLLKNIHFPFNYRIKRNRNSKRLRLKVHPYRGVEVTCPPGTDLDVINQFVQNHQQWVLQQLADISLPEKEIPLPEKLKLEAINRNFELQFLAGKNQYKIDDGFLIISSIDKRDAFIQLRQFIRDAACFTFPELLNELATSHGFEYQKLQVRSQKTRWGSCSSKGNISLNDQLLFMSPEVLKYVMLHELSHTEFLNHSREFWRRVECCCPDFRQREKELKSSRHNIPDWYLKSLYN